MMKELILEIRLFTFKSIDVSLIKAYLRFNPTFSEVTEILDNVRRKNSGWYDFGQYSFLRDYVVGRKQSADDLLIFLSYFPSLLSDDYLKRCIENVNLFSDDPLYSLLKHKKHVDLIVDKLLKYMREGNGWGFRVERYLNLDVFSSEQKNLIVETWLLTKCEDKRDISKVLQKCPSVRGNKNLVNEYVYLCAIDKLEKSSNCNTTQPPAPKVSEDNNNLVSDLILLGAGGAVGGAVSSLLQSDNDSSFSGPGEGEFGGGGGGGSW